MRIFVIIRTVGEYSDRDENAIRYTETEDAAKAAVDLATQEGASMALPPYPKMTPLWNMPMEARRSAIKNNDELREAYRQECRNMGCVDPEGPNKDATYYYEEVSKWEPMS